MRASYKLLTFKVCHVCPDIGVERIDNHLPVCGSGDLDSAVDETRCWGSSLPCVVLTDVLCLGEEVQKVALVELCLPDHTTVEELFAPGIESTVKDREEDADFLGENLLLFAVKLAKDVDILERLLRLVRCRHFGRQLCGNCSGGVLS